MERSLELQRLLNKISVAKLGMDWQTRKQLEQVERKVRDELRGQSTNFRTGPC